MAWVVAALVIGGTCVAVYVATAFAAAQEQDRQREAADE